MFTKLFNRRARNYFIVLLALASFHAALAPTLAQTKPLPEIHQAVPQADSQIPSPAGQQQTQNTVPNPYDDALGSLRSIKTAAPINQRNIDIGVTRILSGQQSSDVFVPSTSSLAFQAAGQGNEAGLLAAANNILNTSLSSVNETSRGMTQWFNDCIVSRLFRNMGQLIGKWLEEFVGGWISDTAQYLGKLLRVFVLNPNIAVNGLGDNPSDGISPLIRQGADVMYGIAVDLLLLLFILCIWKFWADASWGGAGNLMAPVGRLIFTAGLLLAWPTIYAFEIQISNEMIQAVYANTPQEVLMLDSALGQVVKGGVVAAGAGAVSVFAPVLSKLVLPGVGGLVGSVFSFASTLVFTILGGIIIAELVYVLVLKAIQTALLTAQYMFAPVFLVLFATPDTENYATGYVRAFVETSLWTFVWVGLLKIMTIILFSNFNPWGKALILIGVLQLMIQVPSFIGRAQISPVSDFVSAGLVFGTFNKALTGLRDMSTSLVSQGVNWFSGDKSGAPSLGNVAGMMNASSGIAAAPTLLCGLNRSAGAQQRHSRENTSLDPSTLHAGPQPKTQRPPSFSMQEAANLGRPGLESLLKSRSQSGKASSVLSNVRNSGASVASAIVAAPFVRSARVALGGVGIENGGRVILADDMPKTDGGADVCAEDSVSVAQNRHDIQTKPIGADSSIDKSRQVYAKRKETARAVDGTSVLSKGPLSGDAKDGRPAASFADGNSKPGVNGNGKAFLNDKVRLSNEAKPLINGSSGSSSGGSSTVSGGPNVPISSVVSSDFAVTGNESAASISRSAAGSSALLEGSSAALDMSGLPAYVKGTNLVIPVRVSSPSQQNTLVSASSTKRSISPDFLQPQTREFLARISSSDGPALRAGGTATSISGNLSHGVKRVTFPADADEQTITQAIYTASFAHCVADDGIARDAACQAAVQSGRLEPNGILEVVCANWLSNSGDSFTETELARQKFQQTVFEQAVIGAQQYLNCGVGNAYTLYLRDRFGEWTEQHEREAKSLVLVSEGLAALENRSLTPKTDSFFANNRSGRRFQSLPVAGLSPSDSAPFRSFGVKL